VTPNGERLPTGKMSNVFWGPLEGPFWPEGPPPLVVRNRMSQMLRLVTYREPFRGDLVFLEIVFFSPHGWVPSFSETRPLISKGDESGRLETSCELDKGYRREEREGLGREGGRDFWKKT
jgi:hypothetical protein